MKDITKLKLQRYKFRGMAWTIGFFLYAVFFSLAYALYVLELRDMIDWMVNLVQ